MTLGRSTVSKPACPTCHKPVLLTHGCVTSMERTYHPGKCFAAREPVAVGRFMPLAPVIAQMTPRQGQTKSRRWTEKDLAVLDKRSH